jgi:hypothetical protein
MVADVRYSASSITLIVAFDVVGELAFGRKFGFLEEGIASKLTVTKDSTGYRLHESTGRGYHQGFMVW